MIESTPFGEQGPEIKNNIRAKANLVLEFLDLNGAPEKETYLWYIALQMASIQLLVEAHEKHKETKDFILGCFRDSKKNMDVTLKFFEKEWN